MADYHTALSVGVEEDLLPLSALLQQRGVEHRIFEQDGLQVVAVQRQADAAEVATLYRGWRDGKFSIELSGRRTAQASPRASISWRLVPVTFILILLSIVGFLLFYLPLLNPYLAWFTFSPFSVAQGRAVFADGSGQYWRLITPAFLHFGWLHICFNSLWLWELGGKVERVMGHLNMLGLFLVIALVSNASQFAMGGPSLFGGMSGVVYGLLGFSWVAPLFQPGWRIQPSPTLMLFMVGWLVVCLVGLVEVLGFGAIANAAHVGGLLCGAVLGGLFGFVSRRTAE